MDNYIKEYSSYDKKILYIFGKGHGGIGDLVKYFAYVLEYCIENKVQIYYLLTNNALDNYLKLKYPNMYLSKIPDGCINIPKWNDDIILEPNKFYCYRPYALYDITGKLGGPTELFFNRIRIPINEIFYFNNIVESNAKHYNKSNEEYISIHVRCGDKFLDTDAKNVLCKHDQRFFDERTLFDFIRNIKDKRIFFFCDNNKYKTAIKKEFYDVDLNIIFYEIGHTSLNGTTDEQIINTLTDFYIMAHSKELYYFSYSGFPVIAAKYNNIPYYKM